MQNQIDAKIVEGILRFSRNVAQAPNHVLSPDEISLETTEHEVAYREDKMRLLHYKPLTDKQIGTPWS